MPFEWFVLLLRILFIFLLYFFIFQVVRVIGKELRFAAQRQSPDYGNTEISGALLVDNAGESRLRRGQIVPLEPVSVIGRNRRATIYLDEPFTSAEHAQLSWDGGRWWLTDLHSTNGTRINGRRVEVPTRLAVGDRIEIGNVKLQLVP